MSIEDVQLVLDETAEGIERVNEVSALLGNALTEEDLSEVEAEWEAMFGEAAEEAEGAALAAEVRNGGRLQHRGRGRSACALTRWPNQWSPPLQMPSVPTEELPSVPDTPVEAGGPAKTSEYPWPGDWVWVNALCGAPLLCVCVAIPSSGWMDLWATGTHPPRNYCPFFRHGVDSASRRTQPCSGLRR
jgi:hypothetical protein